MPGTTVEVGPHTYYVEDLVNGAKGAKSRGEEFRIKIVAPCHDHVRFTAAAEAGANIEVCEASHFDWTWLEEIAKGVQIGGGKLIVHGHYDNHQREAIRAKAPGRVTFE